MVRALGRLADEVVRAVGSQANPREIEQAVLRGLTLSGEALQALGYLLESAQNGRQSTEGISEAIEDVDRKRMFFQGCTMRRSSQLPPAMDDARPVAERAERLAEGMRGVRDIDRLVEAYKATEALEAEIAELRGSAKAGSAPEPRVLDLPRARVLVARRAIGGTLAALDEDEED